MRGNMGFSTHTAMLGRGDPGWGKGSGLVLTVLARRRGDWLKRGQKRDEAESSEVKGGVQTRVKRTERGRGAGLMKGTAGTADGLCCQGSGWSGNSA